MKTLSILGALLLACGLVAAQPQPVKAGAVTYMCGGVGQSEQQQMKAAESGYDMLLTFATEGGAYQADVDVKITGPRGEPVLSVRCPGPMLLVDLPAAGTWTVSATAGGAVRTATVKTGGGLARQVLTWPAL